MDRGDAYRADLELVRRARAGDSRSVEELVDRLRCVRAFLEAKNRTHGRPLDPQELEDTLQNTLLALWRKLDQYAGEGALEGWAYRFSVLEFLQRIQALERWPRKSFAGSGDESEPSYVAPEPGAFERVYLALEALGDQAEIVRQKHFEGLTLERIAAREGLPLNTVKTRYYRALERLRGLLEPGRREEEGR